MKILRESMTKVQTSRFTVRVWREEPSQLAVADNKDMVALIREVGEDLCGVALAEKIIKIDRVNAVEVLDGMGNGEVIYKDWP